MSKCPQEGCDGEIIEDMMREDGVDWPIWKCSKNAYHWGSR